MVIGTKRDELRNANVGCSPQHVSVALSSIVWSAGNVPTPPIVEQRIAIWNRMGQDEAVKAILLLQQAYYGRDSPFDEYSKVTLMINAFKSNADLAWCAQTMVIERVLGKSDNYSKTELENKLLCAHCDVAHKGCRRCNRSHFAASDRLAREFEGR